MQFKLLTLIVAATVSSITFAWVTPKPDKTPLLFKEARFDSSTIARAVNYFVSSGEENAIRELQELASDEFDLSKGIDVNERIGWVCRILYSPDAGNSLRPPAFGGLSLPHHTMPVKNWPLYPIAKSGESYCVLSQGYELAGEAEPVDAYLKYCRTNGTFRTGEIKVPDRKTATADIRKIRTSKRWTVIKWKNSGPGFSYTFSEQWIWDSIILQAKSTPRPVRTDNTSQVDFAQFPTLTLPGFRWEVPILTRAEDLDPYVGSIVAIRGPIANSKQAHIIGVQVSGGQNLEDACAVGILARFVTTEEEWQLNPDARGQGSWGPGTKYILYQGLDGAGARPQAWGTGFTKDPKNIKTPDESAGQPSDGPKRPGHLKLKQR